MEKAINHRTFQNRLYDTPPDGSFKKNYKSRQPIWVYASAKDYTGKNGILDRPTLSFTTPQEVYRSMDLTEKSPLNALKNFLNAHPCAFFWHNGSLGDACGINGFHAHMLVHTQTERWHDNSCRETRRKLLNGGCAVRTKKVANLPGICHYLQTVPRALLGCNNALISSRLLRFRNSVETPATTDQLKSQFAEDDYVPEQTEEAGDQTNFMADLLGWKQTSSVSRDSESDIEAPVSMAKYIEQLAHEDSNPNQSFDKLRPDQSGGSNSSNVSGTQKLSETQTVKKLSALRQLMDKYQKNSQDDLLRCIVRGKDVTDIQQYRILRTAPNFSVIWNQAISEIAAEKSASGSTYLSTFLKYAHRDDPDALSVPDTAQLFIDWCNHQHISGPEFIRKLYSILSCSYTKINTFALIGASNAGKMFWMNSIACVKDVISSADFMWHECLDKELIYIPELCISKIGQLDKFKQICEGIETTVNKKNRNASILQRTPVLLTTNMAPWEMFAQEREAITNRRFLYFVAECPLLRDTAKANPSVFAELFDFITEYLSSDDSWPYPYQSYSIPVMDDIIQIVIEEMASRPRAGVQTPPTSSHVQDSPQSYSLMREFYEDPQNKEADDDMPDPSDMEVSDVVDGASANVKILVWKLTCGYSLAQNYDIVLSEDNELHFPENAPESLGNYRAVLNILRQAVGLVDNWPYNISSTIGFEEMQKFVCKYVVKKLKQYNNSCVL